MFRNETKEWYHVFVDGEEIVCTGGHPFYVVGEGFVEAKDLKISDKLLLSSGKCVTIEKLEVKTLETAETTYNFEVADFHTYYVGNGVCVHNQNCGKPEIANRGYTDSTYSLEIYSRWCWSARTLADTKRILRRENKNVKLVN